MIKLKLFFLAILLTISSNYTFSQISASDKYSTYLVSAPSGCSQQALENLIEAINRYRADSKMWATVLQPEFTLGGAASDEKGIITIPINSKLMNSAKETAKKFANGTYKELEHFQNGYGATVRAIKDGWAPSMNTLFTADVTPPFTMVQENLFMGTSGKYFWNDVFEGWRTSPGHNTTMLTSGAVSLGCGCADSPVQSDGTKNTYWVLVIETEATVTEHDDTFNNLFAENSFYRVKPGMENKDFSNYKAYEYYEFIDSGLKKIKDQ